ncbi:hypothetical protein C462_00681 [Halorubrum distributum JCM 13916]|uniref:Uncharacterized protein n=1 Tax=Halorubrum distributum JCM 13916 TaxID=1230455 RepID=M0PRJ5_9EURY|nr:hypothetical protein C462_00681 [Halorubrum arcis JCM 13916]
MVCREQFEQSRRCRIDSCDRKIVFPSENQVTVLEYIFERIPISIWSSPLVFTTIQVKRDAGRVGCGRLSEATNCCLIHLRWQHHSFQVYPLVGCHERCWIIRRREAVTTPGDPRIPLVVPLRSGVQC